MGRIIAKPMTRYEWKLSPWMKTALAYLCMRKGRDANVLIEEAMLKAYPELEQHRPMQNVASKRQAG